MFAAVGVGFSGAPSHHLCITPPRAKNQKKKAGTYTGAEASDLKVADYAMGIGVSPQFLNTPCSGRVLWRHGRDTVRFVILHLARTTCMLGYLDHLGNIWHLPFTGNHLRQPPAKYAPASNVNTHTHTHTHMHAHIDCAWLYWRKKDFLPCLAP